MFDQYETVTLTIKQVQEALGETNRYYAREKLGREPTTRELLTHYIDNTVPYRIRVIEVKP